MKNMKIALGLSFVLIIVLGVFVARLSFAAIGDGHFVHSCVKNINGDVRIVDAGVTCNGNETALKWNSDGIDDFGGFVTKNLTNINYGGANLSFRNFKGADFTGSEFSNANLNGANFKNVNLTNSNMPGIMAGDADFSGANFTNASIIGGYMNSSNFTGANFENADLSNSSLEAVIGMNTAITTGVVWDNTSCPDGTNSDNNGNTCEGHF